MIPNPLRILVVDDNPPDQVIIKEALRDALSRNPEIRQAETLTEASTLLGRNHDFDVILLDLSLPDSAGLASVVSIHETAPTVPIVVLTGLDDGDIEGQAIQAGAQDYLVKGAIDDKLIGRVIEHAIERQRLMSRLEEFDRLKSEFLATASHEMRTPLTVLRENTSLIADGICGPINEEQRECLEVVLRHCDRLGSLLNNLLDLQKIEAGGMHLRRVKTDPILFLRQVYADCLPGCRAKDQNLTFCAPEELPHVLIDRDQMTQALMNLIGNARKFTPAGGEITLSVYAAETGEVTVAVRDTGRGIRTEDLDAIFQAFRQSERREGPGERGTGLGLTITKRIIEMHGGVIRVESLPGKGACFWFTLPAWTEFAELGALLSDRVQEAAAKNSRYTVLMIRTTSVKSADALAESVADASRTLRDCDAAVYLRSLRTAVYVFETHVDGALVALRRLAAAHELDLSSIEFVILGLMDSAAIPASLQANSLAWKPGSSL